MIRGASGNMFVFPRLYYVLILINPPLYSSIGSTLMTLGLVHAGGVRKPERCLLWRTILSVSPITTSRLRLRWHAYFRSSLQRGPSITKAAVLTNRFTDRMDKEGHWLLSLALPWSM